MPTPKHSLLAKTIILYLYCTNSQPTSMRVSLNPETCITYQTPTNLITGVMLQRESNTKYIYYYLASSYVCGATSQHLRI